jgi:hypothetical protein
MPKNMLCFIAVKKALSANLFKVSAERMAWFAGSGTPCTVDLRRKTPVRAPFSSARAPEMRLHTRERACAAALSELSLGLKNGLVRPIGHTKTYRLASRNRRARALSQGVLRITARAPHHRCWGAVQCPAGGPRRRRPAPPRPSPPLPAPPRPAPLRSAPPRPAPPTCAEQLLCPARPARPPARRPHPGPRPAHPARTPPTPPAPRPPRPAPHPGHPLAARQHPAHPAHPHPAHPAARTPAHPARTPPSPPTAARTPPTPPHPAHPACTPPRPPARNPPSSSTPRPARR